MNILGTGSEKTSRTGKYTGLGSIVLAVVFLVALVLAANNNTVVGWVIAVIAFAWLALSTLVYIGVHKAARFGADQVRKAQAQFAQASGNATDGAGTRLVSDDAAAAERDKVRDMKLDHSFKIIGVQIGVINEYAGKDQGMVDRALETIEITAHNGRGMIDPNFEARERRASAGQAPAATSAGDDGDEPVSGVVLD
jgi:hypothetical protein